MRHLLDEYVYPALFTSFGFAVIIGVIWLKG